MNKPTVQRPYFAEGRAVYKAMFAPDGSRTVNMFICDAFSKYSATMAVYELNNVFDSRSVGEK